VEREDARLPEAGECEPSSPRETREMQPRAGKTPRRECARVIVHGVAVACALPCSIYQLMLLKMKVRCPENVLSQRVTMILLDQKGNPIEFGELPDDVQRMLRTAVTHVAYALASHL